MSKITKLLIILYALIMAALLTVVYVIPKLTGALTSTIVLEYGSLQVTDEVSCYAVRNESVFLAGNSGNLNYYIPQDTQVRSGVKVMSITASNSSLDEESPYADIVDRLAGNAITTSDFSAPSNGCVSYYADGYEKIFTPELMQGLSYDEVKNFDINVRNLTRESAKRGEPVYKICDNNKWYLTTWVEVAESSKYEVGNSVTIKFEKAEIPAKVFAIEDEGPMWQIIFETNRYYEDFSFIRKADVTIVASDYNGIIIPNESIVAVDGQVGVYVKNKAGDFILKPIRIVASDGVNSIVKVSSFIDEEGKTVSTVEIYDEILKHPN